MDIAVLVDAQGDMLDNIESQVFFITLHITPSSNQDKKKNRVTERSKLVFE